MIAIWKTMTDDQLELFEEKTFKVAWTAVYARHYSEDSEEFATAKEAYDFLKWNADDGWLCQKSIIRPDGTVIDVFPLGPNAWVWDSFEKFEERFV